jgi:hypothetical protein
MTSNDPEDTVDSSEPSHQRSGEHKSYASRNAVETVAVVWTDPLADSMLRIRPTLG